MVRDTRKVLVWGNRTVRVYSDEELDRLKSVFNEAYRLWKTWGKDEGSCAIGCGVAVYHLPPRCRKPRVKIVVPTPFLGDGSRSVKIALNYLAAKGVVAHYECGRMD